MSKSLFELSAEITGVSRIITGLSTQLDNETTDILTPEAMEDALFGVSCHLNRIADDLAEMEIAEAKKARAAS